MAKARDVPELAPDDSFEAAAGKIVGVRAQEVFDHQEGVLDMADIERVHAMRVATRRLRAVLEIFRSCFPQPLFKSVLRDVKALADALGERRDPDVQIDALEDFASKIDARDRAALRSFIDETRFAQSDANRRLEHALAEMERSELRRRLEDLVEAAQVHSRYAELWDGRP